MRSQLNRSFRTALCILGGTPCARQKVQAHSIPVTMSGHRIFTFWEPSNDTIPYLELCRKTWELHLPNHEIICLAYSDIRRYLADDVFDFSILKRAPLPMQKDAIMVALLNAHGGVFMDIDTIVLGSIDPILSKLAHSQVVMFGYHCGFLVSQPHSQLSGLWLENIRERLSRLHRTDALDLQWDYLGNAALYQAMDALICRSEGESFRPSASFQLPKKPQLLARFSNKLKSTRRKLYFSTVFRKYVCSLDRSRYGYILEESHATSGRLSARDKYIDFWFNEHRDIDDIPAVRPAVIGLHNSWTPDWYKALPAQDVLRHPSLLSRTLAYATGQEPSVS